MGAGRSTDEAGEATGVSNEFTIGRSADVIACAYRSVRWARSVGFDDLQSSRLGIVVAELAENALKHAGGGTVTLHLLDEPRSGLEIVVVDQGPGIEDVELAFVDGVSDGRPRSHGVTHGGHDGLGVGLGAVRRLMDEVAIDSSRDSGTRVTARLWRVQSQGG